MNETPIKNGVNVYLTGERVVVHGDLYAFFDDHQLQLALHYVTPFRSVAIEKEEDGNWPSEYDAIFDTEPLPGACVDIKAAQVMMCSPHYSSVRGDIAQLVPDFAARCEKAEMLAMLAEILGTKDE